MESRGSRNTPGTLLTVLKYVALFVALALTSLLFVHLLMGIKLPGDPSKEKGSKPALNREAELLKLKATPEMARFLRAVRDAQRVIIIDGNGAPAEERAQTPLNVLYPDQSMYWELTKSVLTAASPKKAGNIDTT